MPVVSKIMEAEVFCTYITEVRTYTVRTLQRRIGNKRKVARPPQTAGLGQYSRRPQWLAQEIFGTPKMEFGSFPRGLLYWFLCVHSILCTHSMLLGI